MQVIQFFRKPYDFHFSIEKLFRQINPLINQHKNIRPYTSQYHSQGLFARLKMIREARRQSADVNHITGDIHFIAFGLPKKRTILTIHDLGFTKHPNPVARFILWLFWIYLPVKRVAVVTTISQASKNDIIKYARCKPDKIRIIPNFVPQEIQYTPKDFNRKQPVILQIGTKFNKNLERTIQALSGINCHFRIIGKLTSQHIELLQYHNITYSNDSRITDQQLIEEYKNCDLVTFCSTLEGFGMVILEAQATGRPVVTSNLSSMPEVAGGGACLVNPYEVSSIRAGIVSVINEETYRKALIDKGLENCQRFALSSVARQYNQLYQQVHDNAR
jgi:glycosyltransferase involved in cell wall biosynthesis